MEGDGVWMEGGWSMWWRRGVQIGRDAKQIRRRWKLQRSLVGRSGSEKERTMFA